MKTVKLATFIENPDNPQTVTAEDFALLVESLRTMPQTLAASKIAYVTDYTAVDGADLRGQRVVIAGNKRLRALKQLAADHATSADGAVKFDGPLPAEWFYDLTPLGPDARRAWLIKSNIQSGEWDAEKLLALYDREELGDLMGDEAAELLKGMAEDPDKYGDSFQLADGDKSEFGEMNFVVTEKQREEINFAVSLAVYCDGYDGKENTNSNGAALALIVRDWLALKVKEAPDITKARREFEKLREGLCEALKKSGRKASEVDELLGTHGMAGHYFGASQFMFPTREAFEKMRTIMPLDGMDYERCKATEKLYRRAEMLQKKH